MDYVKVKNFPAKKLRFYSWDDFCNQQIVSSTNCSYISIHLESLHSTLYLQSTTQKQNVSAFPEPYSCTTPWIIFHGVINIHASRHGKLSITNEEKVATIITTTVSRLLSQHIQTFKSEMEGFHSVTCHGLALLAHSSARHVEAHSGFCEFGVLNLPTY